jgi:hypothetical protein
VGLKSKKAHERPKLQQPTSPPTLSPSPPGLPPYPPRPRRTDDIDSSRLPVDSAAAGSGASFSSSSSSSSSSSAFPRLPPAYSAAAGCPCLSRRPFLASAAAMAA